jgi:hypothetical protein
MPCSPLGAIELQANKFDGKREALVGMIGDGKNATRQIVILRPQLEQWLLHGAANFPKRVPRRERHARHSRESR